MSFIQAEDVAIGAEDFVTVVPPKIENRRELFNVFKSQLMLPDYFGYNWDAFEECLRDLSWIKQQRVIILHRDRPALPPNEINIYINILNSCLTYWRDRKEHDVVIVMPVKAMPACRTEPD